jgi:hypothetical protein
MKQSPCLLALIIVTAACGEEPVMTGPQRAGVRSASDVGRPRHKESAHSGIVETSPNQTSVSKDLATLRRVSAPFQRFRNAVAEGWSAQITPCMADSALGGMGIHYGKPEFIDGTVRLEQPEVLLYEPDSTGRLNLVAVEYIVPVPAWTKPEPPRLFGRAFHVIPAFNVWALHVWLWKPNPSGMFTDWNPTVSCAHATDVSWMSHD